MLIPLEKVWTPYPPCGYILSLLFFYKNIFDIKQPMNVDMPLNKDTKTKIPIKRRDMAH